MYHFQAKDYICLQPFPYPTTVSHLKLQLCPACMMCIHKSEFTDCDCDGLLPSIVFVYQCLE